MSHDPKHEPFSVALERFDPSAEPFANMTPDKLEGVKLARLAKGDRAGFWEADLHRSAKLPPMERFEHDLGVHLCAWCGIMEKKGRAPYPGWSVRHYVGLMTVALKSVRLRWTAETFPTMTAEQSREWADDAGIEMADTIFADPSEVERLQSELEEKHGGPLIPPGWGEDPTG